ncbi:MAG: UDP-N-acetylmuramoyl-L-alanyl-D-glutamate--2,6-diaminopimelate ligase [Ruminococcus sp.]|nr:UDP-N-acetylmuramoyl-L-alanyl-D-glutamate--2,6-diaminopimelate ligase [Ruminococcus sp.]
MKLSQLLEGIAQTTLPDTDITDVTSDTRKELAPGFAFVCIKGATFDGHNSADEMIKRGAGVVICERDLGLSNQVIVDDTRAVYPRLCARLFGDPQKKLKLIGVTGTNGKTTITTVTKRIFDKLGIKAGLIGTVSNEIGSRVIHTERTTPEPYDLFELFKQMVDEGCEYCVMEVSSQGLEQKRLEGCEFVIGAFTNLTQDHLDVHGTMENYYNAKKILFSQSDRAIINIDDEYGRRYFDEIDIPKKTLSVKGKGDFNASNIRLTAQGLEYDFSDGDITLPVKFAMPGMFNASNSLTVAAIFDSLGFDIKKIIPLLGEIEGVRGRVEVIPTGRDFTVICDYAHTPDALVNVLSAIKECSSGTLKCLFGCGGNRDAGKRPLMAKAAADNADFLIVTSDNPRNEDPELIIKDILTGLEGTDKPYVTIPDRREAIVWAVKNAQPGDIIVLAGKGHEDYQILKGMKKIHFDEREEVAKALEQLG